MAYTALVDGDIVSTAALRAGLSTYNGPKRPAALHAETEVVRRGADRRGKGSYLVYRWPASDVLSTEMIVSMPALLASRASRLSEGRREVGPGASAPRMS